MNFILKFWSWTTQIGIQKDMSFLLQQRIRLSNFIGIIFTTAGVLYTLTLLTQFLFKPALTLFPLIALGLVVLLLNRFRLNILSRFVISLIPALSTLALNLSVKLNNVSEIGISHYISPRFFILSSIVLPLVLFGAGEYLYLLICLALIFCMSFVFYEMIHRSWGIWWDDLGLSAPHYSIVQEDLLFVSITLVFALVFAQAISRKYEINTQKLLRDAALRNQELNAREQKLQETLKEVEKQQEQEKLQNWLNQSLADFSLLIQRKQRSSQFFSLIISHVAKYSQALQGAIYLLEAPSEKGHYLSRQASYASSVEQKGKADTYLLGEGLLGQCAKNKKFMLVEEIPENYAFIPLGINQVQTQYLMYIPLIFDAKLWGVIELLSIEKPNPFQIQFLEKAGENIAIYLSYHQANLDTQSLLEESQESQKVFSAKQSTWQQKEKQYIEEIKLLKEELSHSLASKNDPNSQ